MTKKQKLIWLLWIVPFCCFYLLTPRTINAYDVHLDVPFKAQVPPGTIAPDGRWPLTNNCGQASSLMVFSYYKRIRPTELGIWQVNYWLKFKYNDSRYMDPKGDGWYTDVDQIAILAREYGGFVDSSYHTGRTNTGWTKQDLKDELSNGYPVIVAVRLGMSSDPQVKGHFMVLIGMDDNNAYVNDPGRTNGENNEYSITKFYDSWSTQNRACVSIHPSGITKTSWQFQENGNTEGWIAYNIEYRYENENPYLGFWVNQDDPQRDGVFYIDPDISDPYIISPFLSIDANNYNTVEVCMASNAPDTTGAVYFTTSSSPEWGKDKKVPFAVTNDGKYRTYPVFMVVDPKKWAGTITGIRIDPAINGTPDSNIDKVGFDYIRLTKTSPPSGRVTVDLDTKYWEDGLYQLRITAHATAGDVSSITISGPHIDTATVQTGGGDPHHLYDDGKHHDGAANDGLWWVLLNIKEPPVVGEIITFYITYNDGSSETKQKSIDGVLSETAQLLSPPDGSIVNTLTPKFEWSNPSIPGLTYSVQVDDTNHNRVYDIYDLPDGTTSHRIPSGYLNWGTTYYWLVSGSDPNGNEALTNWDAFTTSGTAASTTAIGQPKFSLSQNYPNPCNPETTIEYSLADSCHVTLKIYNLSGQLIKTLIDEYQQAGSHKITWYGDNDAGQEVASSVYFYRIKAGDFGSTKKMIVLK